MKNNRILALVIIFSLLIGMFPTFNTANVYAEKASGFKYTQDFSGSVNDWNVANLGDWVTSYKKDGTILNNWDRHEDESGNGMLALSPSSRPVFWFSSPVTDGNIHLSYDVYYTGSTKDYSYFWGGFQSKEGTLTDSGIEINDAIDNNGLLNGFGVNTRTNYLNYGMTTSGVGMSTKPCETEKWYKLDVTHENLGGKLVSRYYVDGSLIYTRTDQTFTGNLYGVALYATGNNQNNVIYIDNLVIEHYYETEKEAKVVLGSTVYKNNVESVKSGTNETPSSVIFDGNECWLMDSENPDINIVFSPEFKPYYKDGSFYTVEIDYYDINTIDDDGKTVQGYFRLYYDSLSSDKKIGGTTYTEGTQTWKTAVYELDDADFEKKVDTKYDMQISLKALATNGRKTSPSSVAVKEIRVKRSIGKNPVFVTSTTERTGHTFPWFEKSKIITNTITSFSDNDQNVNISYKLLDENGREVFKKTEELTILAREVKTTTVDIGHIQRCDIYDWVVDVTTQKEVQSCFYPLKVSIIKTDPNGTLNDDIYFVMHADSFNSDETMKNGVHMLKLGNVGGVRSSVYWNNLENNKGEYSWENHNVKAYFDEVKANGMSILPILFGSSKHYGMNITDMPYTDSEIEGWKEYVRHIVPILSNNYGVTRYEVWNEPDVKHFNPRYFDDISDNGGTGKDYANLFKATKEIIKEFDDTIKVGGPTLAGSAYVSNDPTTHKGHKYFEDALNNSFADYADAISIHPYGYLGAAVDTSKSMLDGINRYKTKFMEKNNEVTPEIWFTETGYTTADKLIDSPYTQGALNCRTAIFAKANGLSNLTIFYNMEKKGTVEIDREDMFGHVSSGKVGGEKYGTYFVPEKSYLMIAAMNYVMAETEAKSIHDSSDKKTKISRFTSEKFGKDVLAFYNTEGNKGIKLDLGVNEITYLDCLGNETIKTSDNGVYTFAAEIAPQYIIGDFTKVEYYDTGEDFVIKDIDLTVPGKVTVTVFAENETQNPCMIITEAKKGNRVERIAFDEQSLKQGLNVYTLDMDCTDADTVIAFLWNSMTDIRPISKSYTKKLTFQIGGKQ